MTHYNQELKNYLAQLIQSVNKTFSNPLHYQIKDKYTNYQGGYCWLGAAAEGLDKQNGEIYDYFMSNNYLNLWREITVMNDDRNMDWQEISQQIEERFINE